MFTCKHAMLIALGCYMLLCACSERRADSEAAPPDRAVPAYGPAVQLKGTYQWGFETSAIHLCAQTRQQCRVNVEGSGCWVEFSKAAYGQLTRLQQRDSEADEFGELWLEGLGRIARQPGNFGHLGAYDCQVELTEVRAIDAGPPYLFRPPPP